MNSQKKTTAKHYEDWANRKWRPLMGYMYMTVCVTDFIVFPILWAIFQARVGGEITAWNPLTLQGAGLFHLAMGAILGVAAWSRGKEKLAGVSNFPMSVEPEYEEPTRREYQREHYPEARPVYMTRSGKLAPIIEEPEL